MEVYFRPEPESQLSEIASQAPAPIPSIWLTMLPYACCNGMRAIARVCAKALSRQSAEIL